MKCKAVLDAPAIRSTRQPIGLLKPQLISLGKALGAGRAGRRRSPQRRFVAAKISFGDHGTTYGVNLLACRGRTLFPRRG